MRTPYPQLSWLVLRSTAPWGWGMAFYFSFILFFFFLFSDVWGFFPTHGSVTHFPSFPLSPLPSCFCHCYGDLVHTVQVTDLGRAELSPKAQISAKPT